MFQAIYFCSTNKLTILITKLPLISLPRMFLFLLYNLESFPEFQVYPYIVANLQASEKCNLN